MGVCHERTERKEVRFLWLSSRALGERPFDEFDALSSRMQRANPIRAVAAPRSRSNAAHIV